MYTVVRFESRRKETRLLQALGSSLNRIKQDTFEGLDKVKGRFSCSVCADENWATHTEKISRFLKQFRLVIRRARRNAIKICFDVAIEPEDIANKAYVVMQLPPKLIENLAVEKVGIAFTYYGGTTK